MPNSPTQKWKKCKKELLLNNEPHNSWEVIKVIHYKQKNSNKEIPLVLVQLLHKESVNILLNLKERNGLKFESLKI